MIEKPSSVEALRSIKATEKKELLVPLIGKKEKQQL